MAFTATIKYITRQSGVIAVGVTYLDDATGWTTDKNFDFPDDGTTTQAIAVTEITRVGTQYKADVAKNNTLQSKVGTVITI